MSCHFLSLKYDGYIFCWGIASITFFLDEEEKVQNDLQKQDTYWRKAVTPNGHLALCFRYENKNYLLEDNMYFETL
jgi:hypothetical protein